MTVLIKPVATQLRTKNLLAKPVLAAVLLVLAGCAHQSTNQESSSLSSNPASNETSGREAAQSVAVDAKSDSIASEEEGAAEGQGSIYLGTDVAIRELPYRQPIISYGDAVSLNFEEAPLSEVVHSVLGDTLGFDYVVEHPIQGEVTLRTRSPVPRDELLPILESLLLNNGVVLIRGPGDRFFVSNASAGSTMVPRYESARGVGTGYTNVIVPLQYIGANEMSDILAPVAPESAFVRVDQKRNLLILAGTQIQIEGWLDIIGTFDIDQLAGTSVGIFPITRGKVSEVHEELLHIIDTAEGEEGGIGALVRTTPVERLNSILVVSPRSVYIERVGQWIEQLDSIEDPAAEATLHVYEVINGDASQLAMLLAQIYGESAGGGGSGAGSQVAPGMRQQRTGGAGGAGGAMGGGMPSTGSGSSRGGASITLGETVRVVADDYNNSLLVYASPYEYGKIERILSKLDVVATQVLIEASIIEVTLTDDLQYGLEWTFQNGLGSSYDGTGFLNLNGGDIGPLSPGFAYQITNKADSVRAVVNALAEKSLVNVISTPSILVLDNHTAAIHVGDQQPIQSRQTVTDGGNVQSSIEYKDTGVKLEVTPTVNDGGLVTLDVHQSVTDVGPVDTATQQRSFLNRDVSSRIAVRNGDSAVLGGLIRDNSTAGKSGIPLLMDIPVVGNLFSTTTDVTARTELLVFITPRVVESTEELRSLSIEMKQRMRGLTDFEDLPLNLEN